MRGVLRLSTFRAIWPIVNNEAAGPTNEELVAAAMRDLPAVAQRHRVILDGPGRGYISPANRIPGSGGTGHVVVIEAPAHGQPPRPYHH